MNYIIDIHIFIYDNFTQHIRLHNRHYISFYIMWVRTVFWGVGRYPKAR